MWELKKLQRRVNELEKSFNRTSKVIEELGKEKDTRMRRMLQRGDKIGDVDREEFESALEEMGEAISELAQKLQKQSSRSELISDDILNELRIKASEEEISKYRGPVNEKLKALGLAVKNLHDIVKAVIYPEAPGVTKCLSCGHKAHLPYTNYLQKERKTAPEKKIETCVTRILLCLLRGPRHLLHGHATCPEGKSMEETKT
ncbi:uncharacterized protein LOC129224038 [Uloborus diversus]|uniref:uncharacterized protein LOC129224038 n=1 Tax=Uloborus diversus TaxID=327109 RepID=UPI00240A330E|nr:uncharacterized protein LOC129224038 [Uloborus diversus]